LNFSYPTTIKKLENLEVKDFDGSMEKKQTIIAEFGLPFGHLEVLSIKKSSVIWKEMADSIHDDKRSVNLISL